MFKKMFYSLMLTFAFLVTPAVADTYPDRPITVIVPFAAGGDTDSFARVLADSMSKTLGQNVVIQNIAGASGVAGMSAITKARPDGYTLGVSPVAPLSMHPHMRKVPYTLDSFDYIGLFINSPYIIMVSKSSPWNTFQDMVTSMKANPNKYFFGSSGLGSLQYFALTDLFKKIGVEVKHMPFAGGDADAFQAMAGNRIQVFATTPGALSQHNVRPLAVMASEKDALLADIPTLKDLGVEAYYAMWMTLLAPKGLPADILEKLGTGMKKATEDKEFLARFKRLNLHPVFLNSKDCTLFIEEANIRNGIVIKALMKK